jgi:hypothetical protein
MSAADIRVHAADLLDPDCRADKHRSCVSGRDCCCLCHVATTELLRELTAESQAVGRDFEAAWRRHDAAESPEERVLELVQMDVHLAEGRRISRDMRIVAEALVHGARRG